MRQFTYDNNYHYTGFQDTDTFVPNSTAVSPETDEHKLWNPTTLLWEVIPPVTIVLEAAKQEKISEAREYFNEIISSFEQDAAEFEIATWETQRSEWVRYIADTTALTPYCDTLATARGVDKTLLMEKIGYKVVGIAQVQGSLHKIEDIINSVTITNAVIFNTDIDIIASGVLTLEELLSEQI